MRYYLLAKRAIEGENDDDLNPLSSGSVTWVELGFKEPMLTEMSDADLFAHFMVPALAAFRHYLGITRKGSST